MIKLATAGVDFRSERQIAWVSSNQQWGNSATKLAKCEKGIVHKLTFKEQAQHFGCARIQINTECLQDWNSLKKSAKIKSNVIKLMQSEGRKMGSNPVQLFGSMNPISDDHWVRVEVYRNGQWIENPHNN
jgi:hypothetical protein